MEGRGVTPAKLRPNDKNNFELLRAAAISDALLDKSASVFVSAPVFASVSVSASLSLSVSASAAVLLVRAG